MYNYLYYSGRLVCKVDPAERPPCMAFQRSLSGNALHTHLTIHTILDTEVSTRTRPREGAKETCIVSP